MHENLDISFASPSSDVAFFIYVLHMYMFRGLDSLLALHVRALGTPVSVWGSKRVQRVNYMHM